MRNNPHLLRVHSIVIVYVKALRDKLYKQQDELKHLLRDAKNSSGLWINVSFLHCHNLFSCMHNVDVCMLQYGDSPPKPYHSTPAKVS